jgi:hypothetical protein
VEPPVGDFGLGNGGGNRDIAAARFYRLAAQCASRAGYPQQNRPYQLGPNLASLLSAQWRLRRGRQNGGRLIQPVNDD